MTQKILADHAGLEKVKTGDLIKVKLDLVLGNDITAPVANPALPLLNRLSSPFPGLRDPLKSFVSSSFPYCFLTLLYC